MKEDLKFYLEKTVDPYMTYIDNIYIYRIEGELLKTTKYVAVILPSVFDKNFLVMENHKVMWDGHEIVPTVGSSEFEGQEINRGMQHLIEEQIKKGNIYESISEAIEKAIPRVKAMLDLIESDLTSMITLLKRNYDKLDKDKEAIDNIKEGE